MIVFTVIGVLWFWVICFEIGYHLIPASHVVRGGWVLWLFGREAEKVAAIIAATPGTVKEKDHG